MTWPEADRAMDENVHTCKRCVNTFIREGIIHEDVLGQTAGERTSGRATLGCLGCTGATAEQSCVCPLAYHLQPRY